MSVPAFTGKSSVTAASALSMSVKRAEVPDELIVSG